jgi:hypothetical protein
MADQLSFKELEHLFKYLPGPENSLQIVPEQVKSDANVRLASLILRPFRGAADMTVHGDRSLYPRAQRGILMRHV